MLGAQVLRGLQRRVVARPASTAASVSASSSVCFGTSGRLKSSLARSNACFACCELGVRLLHVGRLLDVGQVLRIGGAVLRERARQRRLLLIEAVLLLLAIELNERLAGRDAIAEVGEDPADLAVGFRRNRHLIDGGQRADDFDGAVDRSPGAPPRPSPASPAASRAARLGATSVFEQPAAGSAATTMTTAKVKRIEMVTLDGGNL